MPEPLYLPTPSLPRHDEMKEELRIYILMRTDIEMPVGKIIAQAGHAVLSTYRSAGGDAVESYMADSQPKITVRCTIKDIQKAMPLCDAKGIPYATIVDAGRTVFGEPTLTCMGIGPVRRCDLPGPIKKLRLYE